MLENLLNKPNVNFGDKKSIDKIIDILSRSGSVPVSDFLEINVPLGSIYLLAQLGILKKEGKGKSERVSLAQKNIHLEMPFALYQSLFNNLKKESLLHKFLTEQNLFLKEDRIFFKNNFMLLRFSPIRNLLLNFDFFLKDDLIPSHFYINPDLQVWFRENIIPAIESFRLSKRPLSQLIKQQKHQESVGAQAEEFVLQYEREQRKNHPNVNNIKIVSTSDAGAGYDIESYKDDDSLWLDKFIEVKSYTETSHFHCHFYWSKNEIEAAKNKRDQYYIYLVDRNSMNNPNYEPIKIVNPFYNLKEDASWTWHNDGFFLEKGKVKK